MLKYESVIELKLDVNQMVAFDPSTAFMDKGYKKLDGRFDSMKTALALISDIPNPEILETGCMRMEDDWGAGMSTRLFADYCERRAGFITSVDIDEKNCALARKCTEDLAEYRNVVCSDSVEYLKQRAEPFDEIVYNYVDLLYLDSYDYPLFDLADLYGNRHDIIPAIQAMQAIDQDEFVDKHFDLIHPSQEHCLKELLAALPLLHDKSVILIDDCSFPGGGKGRLAKIWLENHGWVNIIDEAQSLWIRK